MPQRQKPKQATDQNKPPIPMVMMGHVVGPFGIFGWIKVYPYTEYIDGLLDYSTWWLGRENGEWQKMTVITGHINRTTLNVRLKECVNRAEATRLKGMQIAIPRNQLPQLPESGEAGYYWSNLISAEVINLRGEKLGKVIGLLATGANDVLQVQSLDKNNKEILIPFIDQVVIKKVDLKLNQITVDWGIDY